MKKEKSARKAVHCYPEAFWITVLTAKSNEKKKKKKSL